MGPLILAVVGWTVLILSLWAGWHRPKMGWKIFFTILFLLSFSSSAISLMLQLSPGEFFAFRNQIRDNQWGLLELIATTCISLALSAAEAAFAALVRRLWYAWQKPVPAQL